MVVGLASSSHPTRQDEHNGVNYYKSLDTNILYDPVTKNEVGIWCEESKSIKELPEEDDEELEEEGYESD